MSFSRPKECNLRASCGLRVLGRRRSEIERVALSALATLVFSRQVDSRLQVPAKSLPRLVNNSDVNLL